MILKKFKLFLIKIERYACFDIVAKIKKKK